MEFKILGKTRLHIDGNDLDLGSAKQRGVLALLLYYTGTPVPVDRIAQTLWRGSTPTEVRGKLQPLISRLRGVLARSGSEGRIHKDGDAYRLELAAELVDYHRFRILAEKGRAAAAQNDHQRAKALLREALDLWQGRPLQELDGPWADHCRDQMETFDRVPAQHALLDSRLHLREHVEVMGEAGRLAREHELDENFARLYIQSLDGLGRYARALEFHARFCAHLFDETGAEPGPELRGVYQDILRKQAGTAPAEPAPRRSPPRDLPRDIKRFAGRADLLARMDEVLESGLHGQVVALHGMPGIGKTRLAVRWAHRHVDRFPDGQLVLDLQGFGPGNPLAPDDALGILLAKLDAGPVPVTGQERRAKLRRVLDGQAVLVLLDNASDSNQVRPILDATAACFTIITSRTRPFALPVHDDAHVIHVPPLSATESESLLRDVIGADRADDDPAAVNELAGRSNGHPLALKIVAQHVALRPEIAVADLVEDFKGPEGLGILGSSDDSDDENATLSAAFSWSYRELPADAARMFRLLGLHFTTEFGPEAASALLGEPVSTTTSHLSTLTKANLLQYGAMRRFRLHDLLHGYAVDLVRYENSLGAGKTALTRLLNHYLATATAACQRLNPDLSPVPPLEGLPAVDPFAADQEALDWFTRERANLVAAVPRAVSHGFPEHAWRLAANVHEIFDRLGYYEDLLTCQRAALKAAMVLRDREAQAGTLADTGTVHFRLRQYDEAAQAFEQSLAIARELNLTEMAAIDVNNLANVHLERGEILRAVGLLHNALDSARSLGVPSLEAATLGQLGLAHRRMERDDSALEFYTSALAIWKRIGNLRGQGTTLTKIGSLLHEHGENEEALGRLEAALAVSQASGDRSRTIEALVAKAETHYDLGQFEETINCAERAIELCADAGTAKDHARALHMIGHALVAVDDFAAAERNWIEAVALLGGTGSLEGALIEKHLTELRESSRTIPDPRDPDVRLSSSPSKEVTPR
ncbi:tetratricopeptide repeat protein [Actinosynnema sp. CS-041913]|uniref:AfsR/SARP family transcriptional regulator n=1 Tax=Actinosynnema sp. CS-041913 TaxID=3239917 RepID=UPI003D8F7D3B